MGNILDIIYNYSKQSKLLDKNAVLLIFQILIKKYNIDNINSIHIGNKLNHHTLGYNVSKEIGICLPRIYSYTQKNIYNDNYKNSLNYYLKCNMAILQIILHELEHAIQRMKIKLNSNDIETYLLKIEHDYAAEIWEGYLNSISIKKHINYINKIKDYKLCYLISFKERMAQINSYNKSLQIIEPIKDEDNKLYHLYETYYLVSKICTYTSQDEHLVAPTVFFFESIDKLEELNKIDRSNMSYEDRLKYGLELTADELKQTKELIKKRN